METKPSYGLVTDRLNFNNNRRIETDQMTDGTIYTSLSPDTIIAKLADILFNEPTL